MTDLVRVTGISQSRVSTHLGAAARGGASCATAAKGTQCFYALATDTLPGTAKACSTRRRSSADPTLEGDQTRLRELDAERRGGLPESFADEMERDYSPGRTWQSLAVGIAALLRLGDVLDVGSGDGAAAASLAPYCRSLTCIDTSARHDRGRQGAPRQASRTCGAQVADVHELPFATRRSTRSWCFTRSPTPSTRRAR